jgi:V8-like Glu-specific endopeptidase
MRFLFKFLRSIIGMFISTAVGAGVIIGDDDRKDVYEITDSHISTIAKSTVALIPKERVIKMDDGRYLLKHKLLTDMFKMCANENFADESIIANCSGSLIANNKILTAAHCVDKDETPHAYLRMRDYYAVFNYHKLYPAQTEFIVESSDVYELKKSVYHQFDHHEDIAIFELDRKVEDKTPLKYNRKSHDQVGTPVFMLGHPLGISLKLSDNSNITEVDNKRITFRHQLDTFSVNSGSSVFNAETYEIIGVLVRGTGNNVMDDARGCKRWHQVEANHPKHWLEANYLWNIPKFLK